LGGAAAKGKAHGDQRIGVAFDEPGLDPAGARDALNFHIASLGYLGRGKEEQSRAKPQQSTPSPPTGHG
jgi:hypothetical protein